MIKFRLYIPPVILGFVIVPLLVWPTVIALAVLIFTLTFLAEIIFSFPLLVVRISLQELQLELLVMRVSPTDKPCSTTKSVGNSPAERLLN